MYVKGNLGRRRVRAMLVAAVLILIAAVLPASAAVADASHHPSHQPKPTIVLVHGAWVDTVKRGVKLWI
jgi:multisubunit Na+/H+ antiporter MnhE subunit